MATRPEELLVQAGGSGATVRATAVAGDLAYVVGETPEGLFCSVTAEREAGDWHFVGGSSGTALGSKGASYLWSRSHRFPPGILAAVWRVTGAEVVATYLDETFVVPAHDGWCAWIRGGVEKDPKPTITRS